MCARSTFVSTPLVNLTYSMYAHAVEYSRSKIIIFSYDKQGLSTMYDITTISLKCTIIFCKIFIITLFRKKTQNYERRLNEIEEKFQKREIRTLHQEVKKS